MDHLFSFEMPIWAIIARGTVIYFSIALLFRIMPKRQTGNLSPNDLTALIIVGGLAADGISGGVTRIPDILLMIVVVLLWDHVFNLLEYYFPRFRSIAQDSPTLLVYNGKLLRENLRKEKLTEQELDSNLRKKGIPDIRMIKQAVLETDGQISVIEREKKQDTPNANS